jgi:nucleotide-binding universal stress UspA family protein
MIFDSVVSGVDGSPESLDAARQGARLVAGPGRHLLVGVIDLGVAAKAGYAAGDLVVRMQNELENALEASAEEVGLVHPVERRLLEGAPARALKETLEQERATLLCVGSHEHRRPTGIVIGSVATMLLHEAPCSVLVARAPRDRDRFPCDIVVGLDGSEASRLALEAAEQLRERYGSDLRAVVASGGRDVDVDAAQAASAAAVVDPRSPREALLAAAAEADLLVVGSRGLHGLRAIGSVSERVAHEARCSVLVVR